MTDLKLLPGPRTFAAYVYRIRAYVCVMIALWILATLIGATMALAMPQESRQFVQLISDQMKPMLTDDQFQLLANIFFNNARACAMVVGLGLAFGLFPMLMIFFNGFALGLISALALATSGPLYLLAAIMPHGMIEIPVIILSASIGLRFGHSVLMALLKQEVSLKKELLEGLAVFILWLIPLLFVAAFVESYVTFTIMYFIN